MRAYLLCALQLSFLIFATHSYGNDYLIKVDASAHQQFGLYYPATYKFAIPPGASGLVAQYRRSPTAPWSTLVEKRSGDSFNGIDAVRFDYAGGWAYISIGFAPSSDQIFLHILDRAGEPVDFTFNSLPKYYDGRKAAVTITLDDWMTSTDRIFATACGYLTSYGFHYSAGIISGEVDWNSVQRTIDQNADNMEVASHSATHPCDAAAYANAGYAAETAGSKDAIRNNLTFKGHPYIPAYVEPCGYSDAALASSVTAAGYLLARRAGTYFPAGSTFVAWDPAQQRYGRSAVVFDDSTRPWDSSQLNESNALFDQAFSGGGIYHLMNHPEKGFWNSGSYLQQHLEHIKGKSDIWYAALGELYLYHFLQEMRGNLTMQSIETSLTANFTASPVSGAAPLKVTFSDTSTGSITSRLWDFGDSATSTERTPVHTYNSAGSYTVKLTVTGPAGSNQRARAGYIVVSEPAPVANFTATPRSGTAPLTVSFTDSSRGSITSRLWEFGDLATSTQRNPVHAYKSAGSYTVKLTVTGPGGSNQLVRTGYIEIREPAPVANFSATPVSGTAPLTVSFTDTSAGPITSRLWDFGDSTASTEATPLHTYQSPGSYSVKLTVTGPGGSSERVESAYIMVRANILPLLFQFLESDPERQGSEP